ncbi:hypothetical protein ACFYO7_29405 [Nocardia salmonicida]|uniref:hypothetical protein n=1 Tax=Nocardia salmonicida TaxID=53431 RepID=UPI0036988C9C
MAETVGDRHQVLTDNQWELLELLLPKSDGWRGVATRYDKLACTYRAGIGMALTVEWLKLLGDMTY